MLISGEEGRNAQGLLAAFWTKSAVGALDFTTFDIAIDQELYAPAITGERVVTEPYLTEFGDVLTSAVSPVGVVGQLVDVAGVDISLNDLTTPVGELVPFEGGQSDLVSSSGVWLADLPPRGSLLHNASLRVWFS